jgi:hypothetical protein
VVKNKNRKILKNSLAIFKKTDKNQEKHLRTGGILW